jgi:MoaA/NifB/PqqE/SkfB family radical SAM enzyme
MIDTMYYDPKHIHVELTDKCNAQCPLCQRTDISDVSKTTKYVQNAEINLEDFKLILGDSVNTLKSYNFCGNYGDPLSAKDFLKIVEYVAAPDVRIGVHTNASVKTVDYWKRLGKILSVNPKNYVSFDLDGIDQETHSFYRRNTNFNKIINNAKAFIESTTARSRWQFIVFDYNKHQIEDAKNMALQLGFTEFNSRYSSRFPQSGEISFGDKGKTYNIKRAYDKDNIVHHLGSIVCQAIKREAIFLAATGHIWPCCHTANRMFNDHDIKMIVKKHGIDNIDGRLHSIQEIMDSNIWRDIEISWPLEKPKVCKKTCGYINNRSVSNVSQMETHHVVL